MKIIYRKAASLTLLVSIWVGIAIAGFLSYPDRFQDTSNTISVISSDPIGTIPVIITSAFSPATLLMFGAIFVGGFILSNTIVGGGFPTLFSIPLLIIFVMLQIFVLPTGAILFDEGTPAAVQLIYTAFMVALTILTAITFTSGRN